MTLVEVLIVSAIISVLAFSISASFLNGMKVWERSKRVVLEEDAIIFFEKLQSDLRNAYPYSKIVFEGGEQYFAFPAHLTAPGLERQPIGKVEYRFDILTKVLIRRTGGYGQALSHDYGPSIPVLKGIDNVRFRYIYLTREGEFPSPAVLDTFPAGLDVEVVFTDAGIQKSITKLINIPIAWH